MNQWIYEPEDDMWCFAGETGAIFIKMLWTTGQFIQTIETPEGKIKTSLTGQIRDLSPMFQVKPCTT
jgi:hypothetical protein